jgi:hypothetical protein
MSTFRIQRTRKAPVPMTQKSRQNTWEDLFKSMGKGHWFIVTKANYGKVSQAASVYLKGNYKLYKHPTRKDCHVFVKNI